MGESPSALGNCLGVVRVAVIGSSGYLGSRISEWLEARGFEITRVENTVRFLELPGKHGSSQKDANNVVVFAAGAVQHMVDPQDIEVYTSHYLRTVTEGFAVAKKLGYSRFLLLSSGDVYGFEHSGRVKEDAPVNPSNSYGESRAAGEALASTLARNEGMRLLVARLFLVSGPKQRGRFIGSAQSALREGNSFLVNNPNATRDFVSVVDFLRFIELAIKKQDWREFEVVNVCSGQGHLLLDVAKRIRDFIGGGEIATPDLKASHAAKASLVGDPTKAFAVFGWKSTMNLTEVIESSVGVVE